MRKKIFKAVVYARTSRDSGNDPAIEEQIDRCMEFADRQDSNICVVDIIADQGFDGIALQRPGFNQMVAGDVDCILVDDICRVSSNMLELAYLRGDILPELEADMFFEGISVDCDNPEHSYECLMSVLESYSKARGVDDIHINDVDMHYVR